MRFGFPLPPSPLTSLTLRPSGRFNVITKSPVNVCRTTMDTVTPLTVPSTPLTLVVELTRVGALGGRNSESVAAGEKMSRNQQTIETQCVEIGSLRAWIGFGLSPDLRYLLTLLKGKGPDPTCHLFCFGKRMQIVAQAGVPRYTDPHRASRIGETHPDGKERFLCGTVFQLPFGAMQYRRLTDEFS